jgi:cupin 2 domain-containing protein
MPTVRNIFSSLPAVPGDEAFEELIGSQAVTIERIVSKGHTSSPGFWYDQPRDEWVLVLRGNARVRFDDEHEPLAMGPGDYLHIPAHVLHRVEWTDPDQQTIWLAVHF